SWDFLTQRSGFRRCRRKAICWKSGTTVWLFRRRAELIENWSFGSTSILTRTATCLWRQIVDASIVPVPTQRNSPEENEAGNGGETPAESGEKAPPERQRRALDEAASKAASMCVPSAVIRSRRPKRRQTDEAPYPRAHRACNRAARDRAGRPPSAHHRRS